MDLDALARVFSRTPDTRHPDEDREDHAAGVSRETANATADPGDRTPRPEYGGASLAALRAAAGEDWALIEGRPDALRALGFLLNTEAQRERGERPAHYTEPCLCAHCGRVWLWSGSPTEVRGCPWCIAPPSLGAIPRPP